MENNKKGNTIIKDAAILFVITLVSGLLLGFVYDLTKDVIEGQQMAGQSDAYKVVFADAASFAYNDDLNAIVETYADILEQSDISFGNVLIDEIVEAKDSSGNVVGYVISSSTKDGFSGLIRLCVGITTDKMVTGIEILEISETAGLGMRAADVEYKDQYKDKQVDFFVVTKDGKSADNEIDALGGATITSDAVNNAVNAAVYFADACINR